MPPRKKTAVSLDETTEAPPVDSQDTTTHALTDLTQEPAAPDEDGDADPDTSLADVSDSVPEGTPDPSPDPLDYDLSGVPDDSQYEELDTGVDL